MVAVAVGGRCGLDLIPGLGTSICHRCSWKKKKKKEKKKDALPTAWDPVGPNNKKLL